VGRRRRRRRMRRRWRRPRRFRRRAVCTAGGQACGATVHRELMEAVHLPALQCFVGGARHKGNPAWCWRGRQHSSQALAGTGGVAAVWRCARELAGLGVHLPGHARGRPPLADRAVIRAHGGQAASAAGEDPVQRNGAGGRAEPLLKPVLRMEAVGAAVVVARTHRQRLSLAASDDVCAHHENSHESTTPVHPRLRWSQGRLPASAQRAHVQPRRLAVACDLRRALISRAPQGSALISLRRGMSICPSSGYGCYLPAFL
jgi:hypothetical protein